MTQSAPSSSPAASWRILGHTLDLGDARQVARLTLAYLALHLLLWTLLPTLSHRAPPWDNIEQLVWTQSLEWGYYKHPPAPTWWMYFWTELLGRNVGVTFFAAQLSVVGMLYCVWRMALLVTTPVRALVAVVFTSLIAYHGLRGIMANHNTLQLLPVGLLLWSVLAAVRAVGRRRWLLWALVGAAAALCVLSKYSAAIWFAAIGLWLVLEPRMHRLQAWGPVLLAVAVGLLLLAPHIAWMAHTDFATLRYAQQSVDGHAPSLSGTAAPPPPSHWVDLWNFTTAQLGRLTPALLAFAALCWALRKAPRMAPELPPETARERRFVGFMALGPVAITLLLGVAGVYLASSWATTFFVLFGVLLLRWTPFVEPARLLKTALCIGVAAQIVLAGGLALGRGLLVDQLGRAARSNFPAPALALELEQVWKAHGHTPLHVVAGDTWLSGNVSIHLPTQPLVWIDADRTHAPWVDDATLARCDTLVLIDRGPEAPTPGPLTLQLMEKAAARGTVAVPWTSRRDGPVLTVDWGVVRATQDGCPSRRGQR